MIVSRELENYEPFKTALRALQQIKQTANCFTDSKHDNIISIMSNSGNFEDPSLQTNRKTDIQNYIIGLNVGLVWLI